MPLLDEIGDQLREPRVAVRIGRRQRQAQTRLIHDDHGHAPGYALNERLVLHDAHVAAQDDPFDLSAQEVANVLPLALCIQFAGADECHVLVFPRLLFQGLQELRIVGVPEVGNHDPEGGGLLVSHACGQETRRVVQRGDRLQHPLSRLLVHDRGVVQHP